MNQRPIGFVKQESMKGVTTLSKNELFSLLRQERLGIAEVLGKSDARWMKGFSLLHGKIKKLESRIEQLTREVAELKKLK